jgi:antitoxin CptB
MPDLIRHPPFFLPAPEKKRWTPDQVRGDEGEGGHYRACIRSRLDSQRGHFPLELMDKDDRLKRLRFRAWHRGVREADMLVGGYFDRWHGAWDEAETAWFEAFLDEQDVDILAWAIGTAAVPERWRSEMMTRLQALDYIQLP